MFKIELFWHSTASGNTSPTAPCFEWSLSFKTGLLAYNVREPNLHWYLLIIVQRRDEFMPFSRELAVKCKRPHLGFKLGSLLCNLCLNIQDIAYIKARFFSELTISLYRWSSTCKYPSCPVGWGCRIHWLLLCRGVRPPPNECPGYDTKQSDGEVLVMLGLWGMQSIPS